MKIGIGRRLSGMTVAMVLRMQKRGATNIGRSTYESAPLVFTHSLLDDVNLLLELRLALLYLSHSPPGHCTVI